MKSAEPMTASKPGAELDDVRKVLYDKYLDSQYQHLNDLSDDGFERSIGYQTRSIVPLLPDDRSVRILEIGCGNGAFLLAAVRAGYSDPVGIDASVQQVEFCRAKGLEAECIDGVEYLRGTDRTFGAIVMSDVLEHMRKDYALEVLRLSRERLESGGRVVIRVPNMSNPLNIRTRYADLTHGIGFSIESLSQALRACDFEVASIRGEYQENRRWLVRLVFDRMLWSAFRLFARKTMHLPFHMERGKNLLAVGLKTQPAGSGPA